MKTRVALLLLMLTLALVLPLRAEHDGKIQILLLNDNTTKAKFPKLLAPQKPQLEDIIRLLLTTKSNLPPTQILNLNVNNEFIQRLLDSNHYDKQTAKLPNLDYIFIHYGINDLAKHEDFETNFPQDFHELLAQLHRNHPQTTLIPMTVIPYGNKATGTKINDLIRQVAATEKLTPFDIYPRYAAELQRNPDTLNYRRVTLTKIPENLREFAKAYTVSGTNPEVVILDNRLDAHFGNLPNWFGDRHPNLANYHVIASETAKFLAPLIRARSGAAKAKP